MNSPHRPAWKVSLHGGHSGTYCDHATGTLAEVIEAAAAFGYRTFGVSEHAPRLGQEYLYREEIAMGWDVPMLERLFDEYARTIQDLAHQYTGEFTVLRGFEAEVVPGGRYVDIMLGYRERYAFEYMVGSVHYVDDLSIDGRPDTFEEAVRRRGGLEALAVRYYELLGEMVTRLRPEVVGHFDLIRKNAPSEESVDTPAIREAARAALDAVRRHGAILDLNTAGYRKGLGRPYPAPWIVAEANALGIGFCFGDDSHGPLDVGRDIEPARNYLLEHGVDTVTVLAKEAGAVVKRVVPLA